MVTAELFEDLKLKFPEMQMEDGINQNSVFGNNGHIVAYPKTEEEIVSILKHANVNGKKVNISGNGTKRGFGGVEESADILLSLANYKGIIEHTAGDMTLTVKSGTTFKELKDYLASYNQKIPLDPSWPSHATIGGVIASNDSGPKRLGYGSARDLVIGLKIVYPDGTVIRAGGKTVKNVAGYDMNKLFIGAMGTLGVISEVTLKLRPQPKHESLVLLSFPEENFSDIQPFAASLLDSLMEPVALELFGPSLSKKLTGKSSYLLAISFEDVESATSYQVDFVKHNIPVGCHFSHLEQNDAQAFWNSLYKNPPCGLDLGQEAEKRAALKIGVKNMDIAQIIQLTHQLQETHNLTLEAHGGLGHGLCGIILEGNNADIASAILRLRKTAESLGGYAVARHLPLDLRKQVSVWGERPPYFFLLEGIKAKIDPNRILNQGRFVGGI